MWVLGAGLGLVASLGGGCPAAATSCISDDDCSEGGQCEPGGACSVPDGECETGRRYADDAPSGRAGQCVEGFGTTTGAVPPPFEDPDEDDDVGSGTDTGTPPECPTVGAAIDFELFPGGRYADTTVMPPLGEIEQPDILWLSVLDGTSGSFPVDNDYFAGTYTLYLLVDDTTEYLATEGEITVELGPNHGDPAVLGFSGVRLEEVTVNEDSLETTFVEDGGCVLLEDVEGIEVPWWTCLAQWYSDGEFCDCGCGVYDPDCTDQNATWCEYCDPGSCSGMECDTIDPTNNGLCTEPVWNCDEALYDDGNVCHCGCGLVDPDCLTTAVGSCDVCDAMGSCVPDEANGECVGYIRPDRNWQCTPVPGWTCDVFSYGNGVCDCGCGAVDIDCGDGMPCEICDAPGSCSVEPCPGMIDPMDTTSCVEPG